MKKIEIDKVIITIDNNYCTFNLPSGMSGIQLSNWNITNDEAIEDFKAKHIKGYDRKTPLHDGNVLNMDVGIHTTSPRDTSKKHDVHENFKTKL